MNRSEKSVSSERDSAPIIRADQKARCAYLRYLDNLLDSAFGEAVGTSLEDCENEFRQLSEPQKSAHVAWRRDLRLKLDAVLHAECPGIDPDCCDVEEEVRR